MPPPPQGFSGDTLTREALGWLLHLNSGNASDEDRAAFEAWQNWSEQHRQATARAKRLWGELGPALITKKAGAGKLPAIVVAAIGLAALAYAGGLFGSPASYFADYASSTGEIRHIVLKDGSEVDLDTGTSFDVSDGDRAITLHTGQVFVKVKPGNPTPFTVSTGSVRSVALGTAFAVRRDVGQETILVSESSVRVSGTELAQAVDVAAGFAVTAAHGSALVGPVAADVAAMTAWRNGELRFTQRPLGDVIAELNRYRRGRIVILGGDLKSMPVTGNVEIADVDSFLSSLQTALPVKVLRIPGFTTIIRDSNRP